MSDVSDGMAKDKTDPETLKQPTDRSRMWMEYQIRDRGEGLLTGEPVYDGRCLDGHNAEKNTYLRPWLCAHQGRIEILEAMIEVVRDNQDRGRTVSEWDALFRERGVL